jgi:hypothetical protein
MAKVCTLHTEGEVLNEPRQVDHLAILPEASILLFVQFFATVTRRRPHDASGCLALGHADGRASDQALATGVGDSGAVRSAAATVSTYQCWNLSGGQPRWRTSQS